MSVMTDYQTTTDLQKVLFYNIDQLAVIRICSSKIRIVQQLLPAGYYVFYTAQAVSTRPLHLLTFHSSLSVEWSLDEYLTCIIGVLSLSERQPKGQPIHMTSNQSRDSLSTTLLVFCTCNIANLSLFQLLLLCLNAYLFLIYRYLLIYI